jgi:hypothetical protein
MITDAATLPTVGSQFRPGAIHESSYRSFWKDELKAGNWVMEVLANGYVIPFEYSPPPYEEENNRSAKRQMGFVRQAVAELEAEGVIEFVKTKPTCVSPLTVSEKVKPDGTIKRRLCWDGSRCVNLALRKQRVTLSHLQKALDITKEGDWQIIYDLKSAYHHIKICPEQVRFLGASFTTEQGEKVYFVFKYLPFGLGSAVHCITKMFKPINAFLHNLGIRHTIFIDDGRSLAESETEAEEFHQITYDILDRAGWIREAQKSDRVGEASQVKEYLGFMINTREMTVKLIKSKKEDVVRGVENMIANRNQNISAKDLAKVLGKMAATEPALGHIPLVCARAGYWQLEEATSDGDWQALIQLNSETIEGLKFFVSNIDKFDNSPIRTAATSISVLSIIGAPSEFIKTGFVSNHIRRADEKIWASDASGFATCAYSVTNPELYFRGKLNEQEKQFSSGLRELLAVRQTLEYYLATWEKKTIPQNIYWLTDSENLAQFLKKGSGKPHIQKEVFRVMTISRELNIYIIPIHLLRDDPRIKVADDGSKTVDTDSWSVDIGTFKRINQSFHFTIDLFASDKNAKCRRFYSNFFCVGTTGIDAFVHDWSGEVAWICPPISLLLQTIRKIRQTRMSGILFVPEWPTADFWTEIFGPDSKIKDPFKAVRSCKPFIIQEEHDSRSPFSGYPKFDFLEISFYN